MQDRPRLVAATDRRPPRGLRSEVSVRLRARDCAGAVIEVAMTGLTSARLTGPAIPLQADRDPSRRPPGRRPRHRPPADEPPGARRRGVVEQCAGARRRQ